MRKTVYFLIVCVLFLPSNGLSSALLENEFSSRWEVEQRLEKRTANYLDQKTPLELMGVRTANIVRITSDVSTDKSRRLLKKDTKLIAFFSDLSADAPSFYCQMQRGEMYNCLADPDQDGSFEYFAKNPRDILRDTRKRKAIAEPVEYHRIEAQGSLILRPYYISKNSSVFCIDIELEDDFEIDCFMAKKFVHDTRVQYLFFGPYRYIILLRGGKTASVSIDAAGGRWVTMAVKHAS